jgi:hypothetical protein
MQFQGPSVDVLDNVYALNTAYIAGLRRATPGFELRDEEDPRLADLVRALTEAQAERLAASPFLLFSMREQDDDYWESLFAGDPPRSPDLFAASASTAGAGLVTAALGFLWALSRRNPYAARIVSGASLGWCERLAEHTLIGLLSSASGGVDLPVPRFGNGSVVWIKLLSAGVSSEKEVRQAAHLAALQTMLTQTAAAKRADLPAAACRMPKPPTR